MGLDHSFGVAHGQHAECGRDFQLAAPLQRSLQRGVTRWCDEGAMQHKHIITTYMNRFIMALDT
eukprot:scaffold95216_cov68-Attheya_sp.AAC.14